jgi:nucleotidyltransferase substrate binding protein (TIGR01987 family)
MKTDMQDVRWKQRLENFLLALEQLEAAVQLMRTRPLSQLEEQGVIQAFEFTHELAWNVMKDYFEYQGSVQITGSRDATREAFQRGLIRDGDGWMAMIKSRNLASHTYQASTARDIREDIDKRYFGLFSDFAKMMSGLATRT